MVKAVFDSLAQARPKNHFTVGIMDDVTHTSLAYDTTFDIEPAPMIKPVRASSNNFQTSLVDCG